MKIDNHIKIFIVDDNNVFALTLKSDIENTFSIFPIEVKLFESGEICMSELKKENPQIVILDYQLNSRKPDAVDGIKVLDWIKEINDEIFVIMLTGNDHIDIAIKSFQHGASDYIVKTDTQFKKIIFSLSNCFKIIKAKNDSIKYLRELDDYKKHHSFE
ncbi:MAG: hypothetical protein A2275_09795 [Bacteroidetes bacterium RIFOXYA12_FULL_35_11]|nr:MAG: hypothetical protein A2X01_02125 [Bacteroidetes bacterium GWF2_35_48]OFY82345.1 MAG: hypothetical protein A2275_09795 [Bacteroidetes bacterium RIFOXYA12_FULL_35_11]OFY98725.1 MAG: hypothetical protein A2491_01875 [Bacteroidetes bacterium RIFOXYC12_FULL_35_7]HBX49609.1 hypothetical protein [Bacteroidales bacterium]